MIKPSDRVLEAITRLESNSYWIEIVEWLEQSFQRQNNLNNYLRGEDVFRGQGMSLELEDILNNIKKARGYLK